MTLPRLPIEMITIALQNGANMETHTVLLTYPMQWLYEPLGPRVHRLLIYLLSFLSIPSGWTADIDLSTYINMAGISIRTIANYVSVISKIQKTADTGENIPLFSCCRINYKQISMEIEVNDKYTSSFPEEFAEPITIPYTMLYHRTQVEYRDTLRLAIGISQKYQGRKRFPMEIKMPIMIFLDGSNKQRWRSGTVQDLIVRFNALKDRKFIDGWYVLDGDNEPIHFNCNNERQNALRQRLMRSWTHFTGADIVFEVSPSSWRKR